MAWRDGIAAVARTAEGWVEGTARGERISFVADMPPTTWNMMAANEYGFYANVNPQVDHPRWSQASERRIGAGLLAGRQDTLMFNGYGDQVASLYSGMDLAANY